MITWDDSLSIGVARIDGQHKELIRQYNKLREAYDNEQSPDALLDALCFLRRYADYHFDDEEKLMRQVGYPDRLEHSMLHVTFTGKEFLLFSALKAGDMDVMSSAVDFFEEWITSHISVEDKKIGEYIAKNHPSLIDTHTSRQ